MSPVRNDNAVSEIVGAILMVALTVLLAGVISAFLFGVVGNPTTNAPKSVSGTAVKLSITEVLVTYTGGKDAGLVETVKWTVTPNSGSDNPHTMGSAGSVLRVGSEYKFTSPVTAGYADPTHVTAVAHFSDGKDQVIYDDVI